MSIHIRHNQLHLRLEAYKEMCFILLLCVSSFLPLAAQSPLQHLSELSVLNQNTLYAMTQAQQGMFWLGTEKGIFSYDGLQAKQYFNKYFPIKGIATYKQEGYFVHQKTLYKFQLTQPFLGAKVLFESKHTLNDIYANESGILMLWEEGGAEFVRFAANNLTQSDTLLQNHELRKVVPKNAHTFWAATLTQLFEIQTTATQTQVQRIDNTVFDDLTLQTLATDNAHNLIIADFENNVKIYTSSYQLLDSIKLQNPSQKIQQIQKTQRELFVTNEAGIIRYHLDNHIQYTQKWPESSEIKNTILTSLIDKEQNIWLGSRENGLYKMGCVLDKIVCDKMPDAPIYAIFSPHPHLVWFASGQDLYTLTWQNQKWKLQNKSALLGGKCVVTCITQDAEGNIWLGTFDKGIYGIMTKKAQTLHYTTQNGLKNNNILNIRFEEEGVWICTFEGVSYIKIQDLYKTGIFTHFQSNNGFQGNYTYQSARNPQGEVFFATDGKGALRYKNGIFDHIVYNKHRNEKSFYSVFLHQNKDIAWLSAHDALYIQKDTNTLYIPLEQTTKKGYQFAVEDVDGNIVLVYDEGIMVMEMPAQQFRDYGEIYKCGKLSPNINCQSRFGERQLLIGTSKGIIVYNPLDSNSLHQATLSLDEVSVSLNPIDIETVHDFSHTDNHFSFYFTGYWFSAPEALRYRYRLKGFNEAWIESKDRFAHYPNLSSGTYEFEVQATIHHTFDDAASVTYSFHVALPLWKRSWFVVLCTLLVLGGLYAGLRWRENSLRKQNAIKKQQIEFELQTLKNQINPHFLFNSLNTLIALIEETPKSAISYVSHLADFYRKILTFRDKELITLAQECDITDDYIHILTARFQQNLTLKIEIAPTYLSAKLPSFTLQILLENAVKHNIISQSYPLTISIFTKNDRLIVSNKVKRKKSAPPSTGIGLENIDARCKLLIGKGIEVTQFADTFSVSIPLLQSES